MFFYKNKIENKIDKLSNILQKSNLNEFAYIMGDKKQIIFRNFLAGLFRGIGVGVGVTVITAILVIILNKLVSLNIPIIGKYIGDIVDIVMKSR